MKIQHYFVPSKVGAVLQSRLPKHKFSVISWSTSAGPTLLGQPGGGGAATNAASKPNDLTLYLHYQHDLVTHAVRGKLIEFATLLSYTDATKPPYLTYMMKNIDIHHYAITENPRAEATMMLTLGYTTVQIIGNPASLPGVDVN